MGTEKEGSLWQKWSTASATGWAMTSGHENQILVIQTHPSLVMSCYWGQKGHLRMQTNHLGWSWMCKKELSPKTTTLCSRTENKKDPLSTQTSVISSRYSGRSPPGDRVLLYQSHIQQLPKSGNDWKGQAVVIAVTPGFNLIVSCHGVDV